MAVSKTTTTKATSRAISKEDIEGFAKLLQSLLKPLIAFLTVAIPFLIKSFTAAKKQFDKLPQNALLFLYGFVFCFFGGLYPTLFAAIMAAEHGGRHTLMMAIQDLSDEALVIIEESKKDDEVDADGDGKSDAKQLSSSEYTRRKTSLVLRKMNPEKIDKAIGSMYTVWLSVAAVLSIEFAKTISMALSIADFLKKPCDRFIAPTLQKIIPKDYSKWVPVVLSWIAKAIAMSIAWKVQTVVSATTSALSGGLMMARAAFQALVQRKISLFGLIPDDPTESFVDEGLSYVFAGLGFYTQFKLGFQLPAPFNILLFPFEFAEYYIRWSITKK